MTKCVARVIEVVHAGIHKLAAIEGNGVVPVSDFAVPNRVEIEVESGRQNPCMMYRHTGAGEHCGDTWQEKRHAAFAQAKFEYGMVEANFAQVKGTES